MYKYNQSKTGNKLHKSPGFCVFCLTEQSSFLSDGKVLDSVRKENVWVLLEWHFYGPEARK